MHESPQVPNFGDLEEAEPGWDIDDVWQGYSDGFYPPHWLALVLPDNPFPPPHPGFRSKNWIGGLGGVDHYQAWHGGYRSPVSWFRGGPPKTHADTHSQSESQGLSYCTTPDSSINIRQRPLSAGAVVASRALASHNMQMEKRGLVISRPGTPRRPRTPTKPNAVRQRPSSAVATFRRHPRNSIEVEQAHEEAWAAINGMGRHHKKCPSPRDSSSASFQHAPKPALRQRVEGKAPQKPSGARLSLMARIQGAPVPDGGTNEYERLAADVGRINVGPARPSLTTPVRMSRRVSELHEQLTRYKVNLRRRGQSNSSDSESSSEVSEVVVKELREIFHHDEHSDHESSHAKDQKQTKPQGIDKQPSPQSGARRRPQSAVARKCVANVFPFGRTSVTEQTNTHATQPRIKRAIPLHKTNRTSVILQSASPRSPFD